MVPGINLSEVCFENFNKAVCGANAPMPNTSKKLTKKPISPVLIQLTSSNSFLCFR